ncbi:MAG: beta-glucoside-specific PTS transporter subunit IIABC [Clostridium sp.]|uniref:beta-glucoside-specific PTS transporter subunit IIABC n=2 Tax=Clostridium TaxID=1485 RepID=UPI000669776A|nr:beta-glucoside-specific PTS transporter subunit IIABC [Clostridium paraputrificum]MDB2084954.1 beta-glucoside-specific PTS transporter subunit IIABC [Clostridium paraputrificum]MDU4789557.1 beta-glucoside-specific PTS transporter subunit IIABC [Clostridium sp.]MDU6809430.1 beta-glucoside-specific PTS transporter subunit IIABC [Clostridium sp.]
MKYKDFNTKIIELVGGKDNVQAVVHCMTRLRFTLKDRSKAKTEEIKKMDGVVDVVSNDVAYQIIVGTHVSEVHSELISMLGISGEANSSENKVKKNPIKAVLDLFSESMTPILEPIIAAGMLAGVLSLLSLTGIISAESPTYILLDNIRSSVFFFLPIFMAMSCAKRLNASPFLAVALAATLLSTGINGVEGLSFFGIALPTTTYSNSFIPIILAVWFMGYVQKSLKKVLPKFLHYFLVPVFTLIICLPITLMFFGPIGEWIGSAMSWVCMFLMNTLGNWSVIALYAAVQPFLIMFGAGNFIIPIVVQFHAELGYDPIFYAACTISDIAVAGAMLGYFLRAKNEKQKQLFGTFSFSALMGVTEPAIYGAFVKFRKLFLAVAIGGGLGGLYAGIANVKTYAMAWGLAGLPSYIGNNDYKNFYSMIIAVIIGFVAAAVAAYFLGIPKDSEKAETSDEKAVSSKSDDSMMNKVVVNGCATGKLVKLSEINDKAFSSGALGSGVGIIADNNLVVAPVDGEVVCVFPTKHAFGLKTESGVELLIHIGIDTVELEGKHFTTMVNQGDKVKIGQPLVQVDFDKVKEEGFDPTIIMVVTNTQDYLDVIPVSKDVTSDKEECINIVL